MIHRLLLLVTLFLMLPGCGAVDTAIDRAATRTGAVVGDAIGQRVGEMAAAVAVAQFPDTWSARWTSIYVNHLFTVGFSSGSYSVVEGAYEPGEWTHWQMLDGDEPSGAEVERAFLETTDSGDEWWRVKYVNTEDDEEIVLEALFTENRSEIVRMRAQFPGEEAKELPVEEGSYSYAEPVHLTEQSLEGATVGQERVTVPAGSFEARHVRYGTAGATLDWWIQDDVPGNLVKYSRRLDGGDAETNGPQSWTVELTSYGDGAERQLSN